MENEQRITQAITDFLLDYLIEKSKEESTDPLLDYLIEKSKEESKEKEIFRKLWDSFFG